MRLTEYISSHQGQNRGKPELSKVQKLVMDQLPKTAEEISVELDMPIKNVYCVMSRLKNRGLVKKIPTTWEVA